jgi:hypothetical protein
VADDDQACYVYIQLPGSLETVPCASLKVRSVGAGAFEGTFTYGKRYLERPEVVALDPFHLPLSTRPLKFTKLKGIPGAVRDASPDAVKCSNSVNETGPCDPNQINNLPRLGDPRVTLSVSLFM